MVIPVHKVIPQARWENAADIISTPFQQMMLVVMYVVAAVALLTYCLRMYSKISSKQLGVEDWFMTAAVIFAVALDSTTYIYFKYNFAGFPASDIPPHDPSPGLFWTFIVGLLYNPTLALVKSSVLFFMLRIAGHKVEVRWSCHIINTINLGLMIATFFTVVFQTTPVQAYWNLSLKVQRTINAGQFAISTAILTIITDILVLAIPIYTFIGLRVNKTTRIGVIFIFLASGVVTIIGVMRIVAFKHFFFDKETYDFGDTWGPSYSTIEPNVAIIAACIPSLTPLLRRWLPRVFGTSVKKSSPSWENGYSGEGSRSMQLHNMGRTCAEVRGGHMLSGSQEEMIPSEGIVKTTWVNVSYAPTTMSGRCSKKTDIEKHVRDETRVAI